MKVRDISDAEFSYQIRNLIIQESMAAKVGHIGSALSVADVISALFKDVLYMPGTNNPARDRFILSKGHAALALYAALSIKGIITEAQLQTYCRNGSLLGVHPEHFLEGVDISTGSLGHGLSIGAGLALGARLKGETYRSFVLASDAECNEGSFWEAIMFAGHHHLSNLVLLVDDNGQQAFGKTKDVIDLSSLSDKLCCFGWETYEADGHDTTELKDILTRLDTNKGQPKAVICKTVCGKGVSFMEGKIEWHYLPMTPDQYKQALAELQAHYSHEKSFSKVS